MKFRLLKNENGSYYCPDDPGEACYGQGKPRLSVTDEEAEIIARELCGLDVLEIGTGLGVATRAIYELADDVDTLDTDPWVIENVFPELPRRVWRHPNRNLLSARQWQAAFLDGDHSASAVLDDLRFLSKVVSDHVLVHDSTTNMPDRGSLGDGYPRIELVERYPTLNHLAKYRFVR